MHDTHDIRPYSKFEPRAPKLDQLASSFVETIFRGLNLLNLRRPTERPTDTFCAGELGHCGNNSTLPLSYTLERSFWWPYYVTPECFRMRTASKSATQFTPHTLLIRGVGPAAQALSDCYTKQTFCNRPDLRAYWTLR